MFVEFPGHKGAPRVFRVNPEHVVALEQQDGMTPGRPDIKNYNTKIVLVTGVAYSTPMSLNEVEVKLKIERD